MVTHGTNWRIAAEHPLHQLIVHGGTNAHPLHKLVVCGELTL